MNLNKRLKKGGIIGFMSLTVICFCALVHLDLYRWWDYKTL